MEHSSQNNLSKYSRGLERHTRNANGDPERQTPSSSHQPPTLTRALAGGEGGDFLTSSPESLGGTPAAFYSACP